MISPLAGRGSESASSGFSGSSMMMISAPRPAHRRWRWEPIAVTGSDELLDRVAVCARRVGKSISIPRAQHDAAAIAGELVGEIVGIADTEDLG
jgi:hypothetical protein